MKQPQRRLLPDPPHARHVVGGVPHEGEEIDDPRGIEPVPLLAVRRADLVLEIRPLRGPDHVHAPGEELQHVLVPRHELDVHVALERPGRRRREDVVRLVPPLREHRYPHRVEEPVYYGKLASHVVGHLLPVRLVLRIEAVPLGLPARVERGGEMRRLVSPPQLDEIPGESEDRAGVLAAGVGERGTRERVVRAVGQGVPVEEEERHGRFPFPGSR